MIDIDPRLYPKWFGRDVPEETAVRVFRTLDEQLKRQFGSVLQITPGQTGLLAWKRLQEGRQGDVGGIWPTLPVDLQQAIRDTTTQGRIEVCPEACPDTDLIPNLYCLDMRLAYASCAMALESGKEWRHEAKPAVGWGAGCACRTGYLGWVPAWYHVRFDVPGDWRHVGLLGTPDEGGRAWPVTGWPWKTWASDREVRLARDCGWQVDILERIYAVRTEGRATFERPLRLWAEKLLEMHAADASDINRAAIRNILLHGIGSFASGPRTVKRTIGADEEAPDHTLARESIRPTDEGWEYEDYAPDRRPWAQHPEWAALIWADCRTRLLRQAFVSNGDRCVTGALTLPREQIAGFQLDCIYTTHNPDWPDDGKTGRFRLKKHIPGPIAAPRDIGDINRLMGGAGE